MGDLAEAELTRLIDSIRWVEAPSEDAGPRWGLAFPTEDYPTVRYPVAGETKVDLDTVRYLDREIRISSRRGESTPSVEFDLRISLPPGVRVAVDNAVGPIDGDSVASPLRLSTRHGVIKLGNVRASIDATSEFGDVLISRLGRRCGRPHGSRRHRALAGHSRPRDPLHSARATAGSSDCPRPASSSSTRAPARSTSWAGA